MALSVPHLSLGLGCVLFLEQGAPPARVWRRYGGVALAVLLFYGSMVPQIAFGSATPCALHGQLRMSGALGALAFAFVSRRGRWTDAAAVAGAAAVLNQLLLLVAGDGAAAGGSSSSPNAAAVVGTIFYSLALLLPATGAARTAPLLATASSQSTIGLLLALLLAMALGTSMLPLTAVPTAALAAAALAAAHTPRGGLALQSTMGDLIGGWAGVSSGDLAVPTALAILGALVWLLGGSGPHAFLSSAAGCFVLPLAAAAALLLCTAGHGYRERRARLGSGNARLSIPTGAASADHETSVALLLAHVATGYAAASAGPAATMAHLALLAGLCTATALYGLQQWVLRHWSPQNARDARHMLIDSAALCSCALAPGAARQFAYFGGTGSSAACTAAAAGTAPADAAAACALLALAWSLASGSCWAGAALWPAFASDDGEVYLAGPPDARRLALVFDGLASATPELVAALQKAGATATVFVSGADLAAAGPGIDAGAAHVKALRAAGLSVQCRLGAAGVGGNELAMAAELHATAAALGAGAGAGAAAADGKQQQPGWCLGHASSLGAGPCAAASIGCAAAALGLRTVHVDHSLAACGGDAKALEALVGMGGSVLCLSDCGGRGIPGAKGLAAALATIAEQGLRCVSVDELMLNKYEDAYEPPTARGGSEAPAPALDDEQRKEGKVD